MANPTVPYEPIAWADGRLRLLDQTLLPAELRYIELDDVAQVELSPIKRYQVDPKYTGYHQPEDRTRYHKAPGPLRVGYPTCTFLGDNAVITYGYGCEDDTVGYVACKIKVVPVAWFYE